MPEGVFVFTPAQECARLMKSGGLMVAAARRPIRSGRRGIVFALSAVSVLFAAGEAGAQTDFHTQFFREVNETRLHAKEVNADLLAPRCFERGSEAYAKAEDLFARRRALDDIREQVQVATQYFNLAIDESKTAQSEFATTLMARYDAISSDAARLCPGLWTKAEDMLLSAAALLEDGDTGLARRNAGEAQGMYRSAELEAIKLGLLAPAHELLDRAEELNAKATAGKTLERAYQLLDLAEAMVRQNRYDISEARNLANEAKYEAAHALYLHKIISHMQERKETFEDAFLVSEAAIGRIAAALNVPARFAGGYEPVVQQIIAAVKSRDSARATLAQNLRHARGESEAQYRRAASARASAGTTQGPHSDPERMADDRQQYSKAVARVSALFTPAEGIVLRDGDAVVLRIFGLTFSPETNALTSGSWELLSKINQAIVLFPNCRLTVEGHTEPSESESLNQKNSEACAATVARYLNTFPTPLPHIESQGWGSSSPIADNTTPEGRARNRRIDIIIFPE